MAATSLSTIATSEYAKCIRAEELIRRLGNGGVLTGEIETLMREHGFWPANVTREELGWQGAWDVLWTFAERRERALDEIRDQIMAFTG